MLVKLLVTETLVNFESWIDFGEFPLCSNVLHGPSLGGFIDEISDSLMLFAYVDCR
jgi:hypothetical protein